ncbi:hypothetical protein ACFORJ_04400 [Corynebacterium hansenii]|uniref:Uncharacterized protein n=1 Tax=Corynebacterium hansenii TaxID=394964 RepID=A0ABV7ZNQ9_9CORY|nr:hypothetical protein [Corynebacterium hansenii]WJY98765.1 hypothetical protein CHAN_00605 [Corynebacterium hansenii]
MSEPTTENAAVSDAAPTTIAIVAAPGESGAGSGSGSSSGAESGSGAEPGSGSGAIAVWHVQLAPQLTGDRLSGAWLVDPESDGAAETLANLFAGAAVLAVGEEADVVKRTPGPRVDLAATTKALRTHVKELKDRVAEEKAKPGKDKLVAPRFPAVDDVEPIEFAHVGEPAARPALAWARGLEELTATWSEIESQRRRRDYLREPWGADARPLPLEYVAE